MGSFRNIVLASAVEAAALTRLAPDLAPFRSFWISFSLLFLIQFTGWFVYTALLYPFYLSPLRDLPEPSDNGFLTGQFAYISREPSGVPMRNWIQSIPNNGLIRYRNLFNSERVVLTSPKALAEVLVQRNYEFIKPPQFRQGLGQLLGVGVLLAEGDEHKRQRRMLMPAFSFRHIKDLYPVFWSKGGEVVAKMKETMNMAKALGKDDSDVLEVGTWASRVTLDIIGLAGMGHDFNAVQDPSSELNECYRRVFQPNRGQRIVGLLSMFLPFWLLSRLPLKRNIEVQEARKLIRRVARNLIEEKKRKLEKADLHDVDILSVALTSGSFDDENLVNQLMTFLAAGHETTASAMQWACYSLCKYPAVQKRLRDEIQANLPSVSSGDLATAVTAEMVDKLPYLHAVAQEVLRFIPSVPLTMRMAAHDSTILGHPIPRNTIIIIAPWAVNHSKELWGADADEFNPERWMGEGRTNNGGAESNYSFLTFLHGPRSCIGERFAKAEFATLLAAWVGAFEMEFADPNWQLEIVGGVTARPKGGLKIRMRPTGW